MWQNVANLHNFARLQGPLSFTKQNIAAKSQDWATKLFFILAQLLIIKLLIMKSMGDLQNFQVFYTF